jgi:hypothetical protein
MWITQTLIKEGARQSRTRGSKGKGTKKGTHWRCLKIKLKDYMLTKSLKKIKRDQSLMLLSQNPEEYHLKKTNLICYVIKSMTGVTGMGQR